MPTEPNQLILVLFECCLLIGGVGLAVWLLTSTAARKRWLAGNALPPGSSTLSDFLFCGVLIFLASAVLQLIVQLGLGPVIKASPDHEGLAVVVYSLPLYLGGLLAWKALLPSLRRSWALSSATPWPQPGPRLRWPQALRFGAGYLLVALPVLSVISIGWNWVIQCFNIPIVQQDVVLIFANTKSLYVVGGMLLVACVLAPTYEELLFRAGIFRFARQNPDGVPFLLGAPLMGWGAVDAFRVMFGTPDGPIAKLGPEFLLIGLALAGAGLGVFKLTQKSNFIAHHRRAFAIVLSGCYFGLLHTNWAGFLPLAVLGMGLAIIYEVTGSIRVPIIAHGLFNLNTVLVLLSGLSEFAKP